MIFSLAISELLSRKQMFIVRNFVGRSSMAKMCSL